MDRLEDLLTAESLGSAQARRDRVRSAIEANGCLLFGPGTNGRHLARALAGLPNGSPAIAFVSDVSADQGRTVEGLPVLSRESALAAYGPDLPVINCVYRADVTIGAVCDGLRTSGFRAVLSLPQAHTAFDALPSLYGYGSLDLLAAEADRIVEGYGLLADAGSKASFAQLIAQRVSLDFSVPRPVDPAIYFTPAAPLEGLRAEPFVFVDCGAYVGDTVEGFAAWNGARPAHVVALEPDTASFARLEAVAARCDFPTSCVRAAVGAGEGRIGFLPLGSEASRIAPDAETTVPLVSVDAALARLGLTASYVKYDVEGFEREALAGTRQAIVRDRCGLAVSVYHRPDDLWDILLTLRDWQPDYEFRLREHGPDGVDTVLYALPAG